MFNNLKDKQVKVVWRDVNALGQNKAIAGRLKDVSDDFLLIIRCDGSPLYLNKTSIISIKEHKTNGVSLPKPNPKGDI